METELWDGVGDSIEVAFEATDKVGLKLQGAAAQITACFSHSQTSDHFSLVIMRKHPGKVCTTTCGIEG